MFATVFSNFGASKHSFGEHRLLSVEKPKLQQRLEQMYGATEGSETVAPSVTADRLRNKAADLGRQSVDRPFGGRADAPPIDEDYAKALAEESVTKLLEGQTLRVDPAMRSQLYKAYALMALYPASGDGALTQLTFGLEGGKLVVKNIDPQRQEWALGEVKGQIEYLDGSRTPVTDVTRSRYETPEAFKIRRDEIISRMKKMQDYDPNYRNQEIAQWKLVQSALEDYGSDFALYKDIAGQLETKPERLLELERVHGKEKILAWGKEYPVLYRSVVTQAAQIDADVLRGRENDFVGTGLDANAPGMFKFLRMLETSWNSRPLAVAYYPERLKRLKDNVDVLGPQLPAIPPNVPPPREKISAGLPTYRAKVVELSAKEPKILTHVLSEYDKYWKEDYAEYVKVAANAMSKDPNIFWSSSIRWNPEGTVEKAREIFEKLSPAAQVEILGAVNSLEQLKVINVVAPEGIVGLIRALLTADSPSDVVPGAPPVEPVGPKLLMALGDNEMLYRYLRHAHPAVFTEVENAINAEGAGANIVNLRRKEYIGGSDKAPGDLFKNVVRNYSHANKDLITWNEQNFKLVMVTMANKLDKNVVLYILKLDKAVITKKMIEDNKPVIEFLIGTTEYANILKKKE